METKTTAPQPVTKPYTKSYQQSAQSLREAAALLDQLATMEASPAVEVLQRVTAQIKSAVETFNTGGDLLGKQVMADSMAEIVALGAAQ